MRLWTFEYQVPGADRWNSRAKAFKTEQGAIASARRWQQGMADEDCTVDCRVIELVSDNRGGRISA